MWAHWGSEQQEEPLYRVTYHTYLASGGRLSYKPSIECVVGWTICKTSLFILIFYIFGICWLHHAHVKKDARLSPLFYTASDEKLGVAWEQG